MAQADPVEPLSTTATTYQGKDVRWWAKRAVQARKDANARAATIKVLRAEITHSTTMREAVGLATLIYPRFKECRAWAILRHESWRTAPAGDGGANMIASMYAKNPSSTASGPWQFLTSTFASTPFARFSIHSPYASALAAGWMHQNGRGGEWAISTC